jgi:hypothetical protein
MLTARRFPAFLCVLFLTGVVCAQPAATATVPAMPKAEPVMKHIPAGTMGFVVVNDVKGTLGRVESFLNEIGVGQMMALQEMPGGLLGMLRMAANLGDGFNPNGGFAAIMLDPQQFGIDLPAMIGLSDPKPSAATPPEQEEEPKVPFVLLVPGAGVQEIFGAYPIQPAGKFYKVSLRMGPMFAVKCGDYVALSPTAKALTALLGAPKKASAELSKTQAAALAKSDIAAHINMKVAGPIFTNLLKRFKQQMTAMQQMAPTPMPLAGLKYVYMSMYGDMLTQMDAITITGRFAQTGLVLGGNVRWSPESEWGKTMAAFRPFKGKLLDRLPNLPYVLAIGSGWSGGQEQTKKLALDMIDKLFADKSMAAVPEETKAKARALVPAVYDQISAMQIVAGGAPEGSGVFGVACVIQCKESDAVRKILSDGVEVAEAMIGALTPQMPETAGQVKITYTRNAGLVGQTAFDAIDVSHPELDKLSEDKRAKMTKILGEDRIRIRVAAVDGKTLVVTVGGSEAFLSESIKAARAGGTILKGPEIAEAMKHMPPDPMELVLFSGSNLLEVIARGKQALDPESEPLPFRISSKTPVAAGVSVSGSEMTGVLYIPNSLLRDLFGLLLPMITGGPPSPPPAGSEDDF